MKKLLVATNLLFAGVIYFQSCVLPKQAIIPFAEGSNKNWICSNYADSVFNGITYGTADTMFGKYKANQYSRITSNPNPNTDDSKYVWFSLDIIKKFIYKIEDTLHKKGADPTTRLGIRFYFAAYPDKEVMSKIEDLNKLPTAYAKRHTLFMVPTYDRLEGSIVIHQDFNAFAPLSTAKTPTPGPLVTSTSVKALSNVVMSGFGLTNDIYMQNHGEIGPPPQAGTTFQ